MSTPQITHTIKSRRTGMSHAYSQLLFNEMLKDCNINIEPVVKKTNKVKKLSKFSYSKRKR